ncbi:hypothetical protein [Prevotella sp. KH2C16]|uniref:hypothetical protein n=1 Tax=Prevotella sp. KH2C16 TaxID=1855325 RepID=UPI0008EAC184|nr:hypothetical protein [Prevotella sp. KH2C16]SFG56427.1 hypothetical protein SAMN05216383_12059 [Prevotella sp. KH2C16]
MKELEDYNYKVTYLDYLKCMAFVRIADDAILYTSDSEQLVTTFADGFCTAKNEKFYIE